MGSRIMHYCIGHRIAQKLSIEDHSDFLLGGLAPDGLHEMNHTKEVTHFVEREPTGRRRINYLRFVEKYKERIREPFYLGYLCHLIADEVWSADMYFQKVRSLSAEERSEVRNMSYRDFRRLNGVIIARYGLQRNPHPIPEVIMDEISAESVASLLDDLDKDFDYDETAAHEPLEFLRHDEVFHYIEASVNRCMAFLLKHVMEPQIGELRPAASPNPAADCSGCGKLSD
ncbi:zinc dependent phospholipase C family protein [Paenibacillus oleatilyticus]|uniref:zinc dependent phospholipase C family protein n=1 Tax=Paenibacillus oleatilyticus TaxID=2594886 RepID=UPI001C1FCC33|nr:zinc dependent phospholipase C family protein [Paenibacillus oleatilyticus]MBU7316347.1 zinc dependent phospholipase C family protein [Paenibacillus oleatilyticus]